MGYLATMAFRQDFDLVHEDYYAEELQYQKHMDREKNSGLLGENISCSVDQNEVVLKFPKTIDSGKVIGEVFFFRPSDKKKDIKQVLHLSEGEQRFPLSLFSSGLYKVKVTWQSNGIDYFNEETIVL
jgi:hypothetical protein